jgi:predicted HicB family RNase H-like nuclease
MNALSDGYRGYTATVELNAREGVLQGRINNIRDVISFQAGSVEELDAAFVEAVDDYLDFCASRGTEPDRPFSGRFLVRLDPEDHRAAAIAADRAGVSLNRWVEAAIRERLQRKDGYPGARHGRQVKEEW